MLPLALLAASVSAQLPDKLLAPYCDITLFPTFDISFAARKTGINHYIIGPIIADNAGAPAWGGVNPVGSFYADTIDKLRENKGDVIISIGGPGVDIADKSADVPTLTQKYQSVIDTYKAKYINIEVQGASLNTQNIDKRSQALAALRKANPDLKVFLSLPVYVSGIDFSGEIVLKSAKAAGLSFDRLILLTMNFGKKGAPNGLTGMGGYAITALNGTKTALKRLDLESLPLGVRPMIGKANVPDETFRIEDANQVAKFAESESWITTISYNSINRDNAVDGDLTVSSKITQAPFAFAEAFKPWANITAGVKSDAEAKDSGAVEFKLNFGLLAASVGLYVLAL